MNMNYFQYKGVNAMGQMLAVPFILFMVIGISVGVNNYIL